MDLHVQSEVSLRISDWHRGLRWPAFWKSRCMLSRIDSGGLVFHLRGEKGSKEEGIALQVLRRIKQVPKLASGGAQSTAHKLFVSQAFPVRACWDKVFRRARVLFSESALSDSIIQTFSQHAKPHSLQCAMRTWLNGWPATARLHTDLQRCVFGCGGVDDPSHYLRDCSRFRGAMELALGSEASPGL